MDCSTINLVSDLAELQKRLGYHFRDENLLRLALTHPSVAHESGLVSAHNQRLEFLGDAVLQLVLTHKLYEKFPAFDEGTLTKSRAKLVNRNTLAEHGRALGLGAHLILSRGEEATGGRERASALADAFESLLGAIFLDGGFDVAQEFVLREFAADFGELDEPAGIENPKGELQELLQARSYGGAGIPDSFPRAAPITTATLNAPWCTKASNSRGVAAKAKRPPKAMRPWRR